MRKIVTNEYIEQDRYTILRINSPTHGSFDVLIDNEDVSRCKEHKWCVNKYKRQSKHNYFYVVNGKGILLHRFLMNVTDRNQIVDHVEGKIIDNILDNRKEKLQVCSNKENLRKQQFRTTNTSGYTGVSWYPYHNYNKWKAKIVVDYKCINLGYFDNIEDAIKARKDAELKYFGEFQPIGNLDDKTAINT